MSRETRTASSPTSLANLSRRSFLKQLAVLSSSLVLPACTRDNSPPSSSSQPSTTVAEIRSQGERTITWYMNIDPTRNSWAENIIIPGFQKEHPDIKVRLQTVPWPEHDSKLLALAATDSSPDVHSLWGQSGGATFVYKDIIQPLDDLIARYGWDLGRIPEKLRQIYTFQGKLYGVPMFSLGSFIFYNRTLFDNASVPYPPASWSDESWTWGEMIARASKLTSDINDPNKAQYGIHVGMPDLYVGVPWLFGAEPFSEQDYQQGKATSINLTSPEYISSIESKVALIYDHKVSPTPAVIQAISPDGLTLPTGRIAMIYDGGWNFYPFKQLTNLNWGVGAVPRQMGRKVPNFSDPWFISKSSKDPEAAFTFVKYLTTGAGQRSIALDLGAPPADSTLLSLWYQSFPTIDASVLEETYRGALEQAQENAASLLYGYGPMEDIYNQTTTTIIQGEKPARDVLPGVESKINLMLKELI